MTSGVQETSAPRRQGTRIVNKTMGWKSTVARLMENLSSPVFQTEKIYLSAKRDSVMARMWRAAARSRQVVPAGCAR